VLINEGSVSGWCSSRRPDVGRYRHCRRACASGLASRRVECTGMAVPPSRLQETQVSWRTVGRWQWKGLR